MWKLKKLVHSYFEQENCFCSYLKREKSGTLLFGAPKLYITTVWSKEKEDDCYFKTEKRVHSYLEHEKNGSQLFES